MSVPTGAAPADLAAPPVTGAEPAWRRWWERGVVAGSALVMLILGYQARWICDDALIFTRTVREILVGNGPVYSPGERAEASTSTLWQWILALGGFVTGQTDTSPHSWILGLALTVAGVAVVVDATRRLHHALSPGRLILPLGVLVLLAVRPVWEYATSGLETGLSTFWMAGCWWLLVRVRHHYSRRVLLTASAVFGLGPLVRPDLAIVSAVFLVSVWLVARPSWKLTAVGALAAGALPVAYEIFRMGYYGIIFPMPALTKEAGSSLWGRGFDYAADLGNTYWLWVPLLAVGIVIFLLGLGLRRSAKDLIVLLTPVVAALFVTVYVLKVGGDYMHARMLLPPLFLLLAPVSVVPFSRNFVPLTAGVLIWAVVCGVTLRFDVKPGTQMIDDERAFYVDFTGKTYPVDAGDYVNSGGYEFTRDAINAELASGRRSLLYFGPNFEVVSVPLKPGQKEPIAVIGVFLGVTGAATPADARVVDFWGLVNPIGSRLEYPVGKPGHSKPLPNAWLVADYADPSAPVSPTGNFFQPQANVTPEAVAAARHALSCGDLKEIQESTRAPMSASRFWKNLTGAVSRTQVRIPPDPFEAEKKFCKS